MNDTQKTQVREALKAAGVRPEVYASDFYMVALYPPYDVEEAQWYTRLDLRGNSLMITNAQAYVIRDALSMTDVPVLDESEAIQMRALNPVVP